MIPQEADQTHIEYGFPVGNTCARQEVSLYQLSPFKELPGPP